MFLNVDKHSPGKLAVIDDSGFSATYADICRTIKEFDALKLSRCIIFCMCESPDMTQQIWNMLIGLGMIVIGSIITWIAKESEAAHGEYDYL